MAVRTVGLRSRCGIGIVAVSKPEFVSRSRARIANESGVIAARLALERRGVSVDDNGYALMRRSPDAKVHAFVDELRANRAAAFAGHGCAWCKVLTCLSRRALGWSGRETRRLSRRALGWSGRETRRLSRRA